MIMTQLDCNDSSRDRDVSSFTAPEQPPRIFFHPDPGLLPPLQPGFLLDMSVVIIFNVT